MDAAIQWRRIRRYSNVQVVRVRGIATVSVRKGTGRITNCCVLCNAIQYLHKNEVEKCSFSSHLTPKQKTQIVNLVGERCLIDCCIEEEEAEALWDTGSQVCLTGSQWLRDRGVEKELKSISEILGHEVMVEAVDGKNIPYEGVVNLNVRLNGKTLQVPFLVTKENVETPIIGTNFIKNRVSESEPHFNQ